MWAPGEGWGGRWALCHRAAYSDDEAWPQNSLRAARRSEVRLAPYGSSSSFCADGRGAPTRTATARTSRVVGADLVARPRARRPRASPVAPGRIGAVVCVTPAPPPSVSNVSAWADASGWRRSGGSGRRRTSRGETWMRPSTIAAVTLIDAAGRSRLAWLLAAAREPASAASGAQCTADPHGRREPATPRRRGACRGFRCNGAVRAVRRRGVSPAAHVSAAASGRPARRQPLATAEFLAVDTETNGLARERCELTEVGAVLVGGGELHDRWSSLVGVSAPLSPRDPALHRDLAGDGRRGAAARGGAARARPAAARPRAGRALGALRPRRAARGVRARRARLARAARAVHGRDGAPVRAAAAPPRARGAGRRARDRGRGDAPRAAGRRDVRARVLRAVRRA